MTNQNIYDYQNEVLGTENILIENFENGMINYENALKTILFSIIVFILTNDMFVYYLKKIFGKNLDINIIQTLLFAIIFYSLISNI